MEKAKTFTKTGWHPKGKDGGKESWRGDYKGINQVAGWVGKGKNTTAGGTTTTHTARPLGTLKDPAAFGPPPRNVNYHGAAAVLERTNSADVTDSAPASPISTLSEGAIHAQGRKVPPPIPSRGTIDSSKPTTTPMYTASAPTKKIPPQLPPRQNSTPSSPLPTSNSPPPAYSLRKGDISPIPTRSTSAVDSAAGSLNRTHISRLGAAGISVPGFGIGNGNTGPKVPSAASSPYSTHPNRPPDTGTKTTTEGTSWQEKQAAMRTAAAFRNDPGSVSLNDARATVSTANNFRARHGDQVVQGVKAGKKLDDRLGGGLTASASAAAAASSNGIQQQQPQQVSALSFSGMGIASGIFKKAPPPPPPTPSQSTGSAPPPVPLSSKPR